MDHLVNEEEETQPTLWWNIFYSVLFSIGWIGFGYALAYSSNSQFVYIKSGLLTEIHARIYGSLLAIGALIGSTLTGILLVSLIGHKNSLISSFCIVAIGWLLHVFILLPYFDESEYKRFMLLISARIIVGLGNGISSICVPICVSETLSSSHRNVLQFLPPFAMNFGMFISYLVGYILLLRDHSLNQMAGFIQNTPFDTKASVSISLTWAPLIGMLLAIVGLVSVLFCTDIDTKKGSTDGPYDPLIDENPPLLVTIQETLQLFKKRSVMKQFLVGFGIMFFQQMIGINVVIFNATSIFSHSFQNTDENPLIGSLIGVILGCVILLSTVGTIVMGKYLRRNVLLYISSFIIFLLLVLLGFHFYFKWNCPLLGSLLVISYVFVFFCSWSPVPWLIMSEIYFHDIKPLGCGFSTFICWTFTFIITVAYGPLVKAIQIYSIFWLLSGMTVLSVLFVFSFVPETKFKTFDEIQEIFER